MRIGKWLWPWLVALILMTVGLRSWIHKYPRRAGPEARDGQGRDGKDTLFSLLPVSHAVENTDTTATVDSALRKNPFRKVGEEGYAHPVSPTTPVSPLRKWILKGTAGDAVATVLDSVGAKHLLRTGDTLGGMRVLEIHPSRVLRPRGASAVRRVRLGVRSRR